MTDRPSPNAQAIDALSTYPALAPAEAASAVGFGLVVVMGHVGSQRVATNRSYSTYLTANT